MTLRKNSDKHRRIAKKVIELETAVESFGIRLEYRTDFGIFRETARTITDLAEVTGVFDNRKCDIGSDNGFWIQATDEVGTVIHRQAIRHDDLTGSTLARHWLNESHKFAPAGYDIIIDKSDFDTAPAANEITGNVCYHGEFWLDQPYRKMQLASFLSRLCILQGQTRFSADFVYGMMPPKLIERGWSIRAGYLHVHPWAPRWHIRGESKYYDEYLVWISGQELEGLWAARKRNIDILGGEYVGNDYGGATAEHMPG